MKIGITITGTPLRACGAHGCCERYAAFFSGAKTILNPAAFNMPCSVDSLGFPFYALRWWLRFTLAPGYLCHHHNHLPRFRFFLNLKVAWRQFLSFYDIDGQTATLSSITDLYHYQTRSFSFLGAARDS